MAIKKIIFCCIITSFAQSVNSQIKVQWETNVSTSYGAKMDVRQNSDGSFIFASGYKILKLSSTGQTVWEKTLPTNTYGTLCSIVQTNDGGYVACGIGHDYAGALLLKLDRSGQIVQTKYYSRGMSLGGDFNWFTNLIVRTDGNLKIISSVFRVFYAPIQF
jgi:hypothetical protein